MAELYCAYEVYIHSVIGITQEGCLAGTPLVFSPTIGDY